MIESPSVWPSREVQRADVLTVQMHGDIMIERDNRQSIVRRGLHIHMD